ncbi:hypothetical protein AEYBE204_18655 [Asticcacaulis sp. YBE204]|nr:hypothetical protein AEYBE204_18655 [Asticcacaulis sp. YBE204]
MTVDKHADVALPADQAYQRAEAILSEMKADIAAPIPPASLMALIPHKGFGNPIRFRCQVMIQPTGPTSSRVAFGIRTDWNSTFLTLGIMGGICLFNIFFLTAAVGLLAPLFSIAAMGWIVYDYATAIPNRIGKQLGTRLTSGVSAPAPQPAPIVAMTPAAPPPQPAAPQAPVPVPPAPLPTEETDIIARIEKLAVLRDKGLLSPEEYESRRTALLDRL